MATWPVKRMDELCEITSSKRIFAADYVSEGVPFYRGREITEKYKGNLDVSTELFITEEKFSEIERKFGAPKSGDLLLTSVGTLGSVYVVKPSDRFYFKDGNLTWFRNFQELDSRFLYYWLGSPQGKAELQKATIGSSQSAFTIVLLKGMEMELPPLPVQRRIAGILSAYDELMENSQRRIRLLEAMARALYREWFVHFRFPGHEKHPRVASPLGDIPQGWEVLPISTIANIVLGGTPSRSINEYWYGGTIPWLKSGKLNDLRVIEGSELITARGFEMSATKLMPPKTVLVAITGAILISFLEIEACANQSVIGIYETKKVCPEYLHIYLSENISLFESKMSGSAQQHINKDIVEQTLVLVPHEKPGYAFRLFVQPLYEEIALLLFKIQNLRRTRDLLLPRLLSGQVHQIKTEP